MVQACEGAHRIQGCEARFAITDRRFPSDHTGFARDCVSHGCPDQGQRDTVLDAVKDEPPSAVAQKGAILDGVCARCHWRRRMVGTKKRPCGRTKKLDQIQADVN